METPSAISGNPSWHLADSPAVNGATGHSRSLDARKMIPMTTVKQALREASNEFKLRCQQTFNDLTSQLHITPGTAYQSFEQVINELFRDGVKWGHIMAFFSFGGTLCMKSIDKEIQVSVSQVTTSMATYLNNHLEPLIQENGGQDTFVELYENNTTTESQKGQERFTCWSLTTRLWLVWFCRACSSTHSNYSFHYSHSYFIQAYVPLPSVIAIENLQFNKTLHFVNYIDYRLYTCFNSSVTLKYESLERGSHGRTCLPTTL